MTREEYERLLQSDYWKGYSYSLIKERNFTCEDCGRQFPNERNKLQVHHLVYRDVNPWSYRPDELVVLCEECHRKRHGINNDTKHNINDSWQRASYSSSFDSSSWANGIDSKQPPYGNQSNGNGRSTKKHRKKFKFIHVLLILLLLLIVSYCWDSQIKQKKETTTEKSLKNVDKSKKSNKKQTRKKPINKSHNLPQKRHSDTHSTPVEEEYLEPLQMDERDVFVKPIERTIEEEVEALTRNAKSHNESSTLELLERKNHADVVKRAYRRGIDTSGTTLDILERINHADVVERAKKAGVSTKGSTLDILERMNHADVVKRAYRRGIDTSGTTLDILERINHADVVERAKKAGVSTNGSTLDILERLNRKELEKYNL